MRQQSKEKRTTEKECSKIDNIIPEKQILTVYCCNYCNFSCNIKKEANKHKISKQHTQNENKEEENIEMVNKYTCVNCDKCYDKYISCWKHTKNCQGMKNNLVILPEESNTEFQKKDAMELLIEKIIENSNTQMMENNKLLLENNKQIAEQIATAVATAVTTIMSQHNKIITTNNNNTINTTNNNTNNSNNTTNNQQFNLNFFLNETCKDAINFSDFIENIQVTSDDLENNVKMGFVNGMTKIIVDNLKQLTQNERPIHCTDVKRETIYVKEEDQWDKENSNKVIQRGIQDITCKNMQQLCQWREENPEYTDFESNLSDKSIAMQQNSLAGTKREDYYPKIIKNIAKETIINEKTLQ